MDYPYDLGPYSRKMTTASAEVRSTFSTGNFAPLCLTAAQCQKRPFWFLAAWHCRALRGCSG